MRAGRGGRIVRVMSASTSDTGHVERARGRAEKHQIGRRRPSAALQPDAETQPVSGLVAPPTPLPPSELVAHAHEVRALLDELAALTGSENAWGLRVLRRNVELAIMSPETLDRPENQMDFIEELTEAIWDGADSGFRYAVKPAATQEGARAREERREAIVARLDRLADQLCKQVEHWQAFEGADAAAPLDSRRLPQAEHMV